MFSSYSWTDHLTGYIVAVILICAVYYGYVLYRYFPNERRRLFRKDRGETDNSDGYTWDDHGESFQVASDTVSDTERLMSMIKALVTDSVAKYYTRSVVLLHLSEAFKGFPDLNEPSFRSSINEFVVSQFESRGSLLLKEEEVDVLWP